MIHYHGTPAGGNKKDKVSFLRGRHGLVSFFRPDDIDIVASCCKTFVLDNGAFSHWTAGKGDIDFYAYAEWVNKYAKHPAFDWCLIPDKIDGSEDQNADLVSKWVRSGFIAKGVPVWHMHESLEYLEYLITNFEWVAFGSSGDWSTPNTKAWWERMAEVMSVACDEQGRPRAKYHGLRMLNTKVFSRLPLSSADSTNAAVNSGAKPRYEKASPYIPKERWLRAEVLAQDIESVLSASTWTGL